MAVKIIILANSLQKNLPKEIDRSNTIHKINFLIPKIFPTIYFTATFKFTLKIHSKKINIEKTRINARILFNQKKKISDSNFHNCHHENHTRNIRMPKNIQSFFSGEITFSW